MVFTSRKSLNPCQTSAGQFENPTLGAFGHGDALIDEEVLEASRLGLAQTLESVAGLAMTERRCFRYGCGIELFPTMAERQGALEAFPSKEAPIGQDPLASQSAKSHRHRF